jgi:hypothetical protein
MDSPIPDPSGFTESVAAQSLAKGPRPAWLAPLLCAEVLVTVGQSIQSMVGNTYVVQSGSAYTSTEHGSPAPFIFLALIWMIILYLLWRGSNFARLIVIYVSVLGILEVVWIALQQPLAQAMTVANTIIAVCWLWFLTRRSPVAFTRGLPPLGD